MLNSEANDVSGAPMANHVEQPQTDRLWCQFNLGHSACVPVARLAGLLLRTVIPTVMLVIVSSSVVQTAWSADGQPPAAPSVGTSSVAGAPQKLPVGSAASTSPPAPLSPAPTPVPVPAAVMPPAGGVAPARLPAESSEVTAAVPLVAPPGFLVEQFAGDNLAHDIYSMTLDAQGRVIVSGAGYIRTLIDDDGNGRADRAIEFAAGPKTGAQGMCLHGTSLLVVGDGGLLRYRDENQDQQADGPPEVFLKWKTGGEHDVHAIQQGPDGWWYVIAGNMAGITSRYVTLPTSPVKVPRAGTILRLTPDLTKAEVLCEGLRNAYDFAFLANGDLTTFDSDDERDISLPWYRPNRVFVCSPTADCGWVSEGWKRPDDYPESPSVLASLGRGSPTGMVCYRHLRFPKPYQGALFVLDWTYGRVIALPMPEKEDSPQPDPVDFLHGVGGYGFAPTDIEVGPDGDLWVCVGGRGTQGAVYRIRSDVSASTVPTSQIVTSTDALSPVLGAPQPLAAWSRAKWMPEAKKLGAEVFLAAAQDRQRRKEERVRAIEVLTELFGGLNTQSAAALAVDPEAAVRSRTAWSIVRCATSDQDTLLGTLLADRNQDVARAALEACLCRGSTADSRSWVPGLIGQLGSPRRINRNLAAEVVARIDASRLPELAAGTRSSPAATLAYATGWLTRSAEPSTRERLAILPLALAVLERGESTTLRLGAVRLMQRLLGDLGLPAAGFVALEGYSTPLNLNEFERELDPVIARCAELLPTGDITLDREVSRLVAQIGPYHVGLLDRVLDKLTAESDPVEDIHYLLVASRIPVPRTTAQTSRIASGVLGVTTKFVQRKLPQDSHWTDRFRETYTQLATVDTALAPAIAANADFGRPGHIVFLSEMPPQTLPAVVAAFARQMTNDPAYPWNSDVVFLLAESTEPAHQELLARQWDNQAVRSAMLITSSVRPDAANRARFVEGLQSSQREVTTACLGALAKLARSEDCQEQLALLAAARRLGQEQEQGALVRQALSLLERNTGRSFTSKESPPPAAEELALWTQYLQQRWPAESAAALGGEEQELASVLARLSKLPWTSADPVRGAEIAQKRQCLSCHGGSSALGPDLGGVTGRFSKADLFTSLVVPSRDVSHRYQSTLIETDAGQTYSGLVVYESVDGLLLRNATHQTFRVETRSIVDRKRSTVSLMPTGLLKGLTDQDLADLYAYLETSGRGTAPMGDNSAPPVSARVDRPSAPITPLTSTAASAPPAGSPSLSTGSPTPVTAASNTQPTGSP